MNNGSNHEHLEQPERRRTKAGSFGFFDTVSAPLKLTHNICQAILQQLWNISYSLAITRISNTNLIVIYETLGIIPP